MRKYQIVLIVCCALQIVSCGDRNEPTTETSRVTPTFNISAKYTLGGGPFGSVVTSNGTAWITQSTNGTVVQMSLGTGQVTNSITLGAAGVIYPFNLDKNQDGSRIYVGAFDESAHNLGVVAAINTTGTPAIVDRFTVSGDVSDIIAMPTGNIVYIGMKEGPIHKVALANGGGSIVKSNISLPTTAAYHLAWNRDRSYLYASSYGAGVYKLDPTSLTSVAQYSATNLALQGLAFSADWTKLYVASQSGGVGVIVLDAATLQRVGTNENSTCPGIGLLLAEYLLYDACTTEGLVQVFDPLSNILAEWNNVAGRPREMSYDPGTQKVVVPNEMGWVSVLTPPPDRRIKFAAPNGAPGPGTIEQPWDLSTAITSVTPGTTVYLRGGPTSYGPGVDKDITNSGTSFAPIAFRQYPGERVTIDGRLKIHGQYLTLWGLEIMDSHPTQHTDAVLGDGKGWKGIEVAGSAHRIELINMVVHDAATSGVIFYWPAGEVHLRNSILYNNGSQTLDHGIYMQNRQDATHTGEQWVQGSVIFDNFAYGVHAFSDPTPQSNYPLANINVVNSILFDNGGISSVGEKSNIIMGSDIDGSTDLNAIGNLSYWSVPPSLTGGKQVGIEMGFGGVGQSMSVESNTLLGGKEGLRIHRWSTATVTNNRVGGSSVDVPNIAVQLLETGGLTGYTWNSNVYDANPTRRGWVAPFADTGSLSHFLAVTGFPRPFTASADNATNIPFAATTRLVLNDADRKRAFLAVYNPSGASTVTVSLSSFLTASPSCVRYQVYNVQALYGAPVASPPCTTTTVTLPMTGVSPPTPIERGNTGPITGPYFHVFLVTKQ